MPEPIEWLARREGLGLSQAAVAAWVGVSQTGWSRWEAGDREPRDPVGLSLRLRELEEILLDLVDELVEQVRHASGVTDSPQVRLRTYASDADYHAADARARDAGLPAALHRVAAARAAVEADVDLDVHVTIWA